MSGGWQGSTRHGRLPKGWQAKRKRILRRDPVCRICHQRPSAEADHIRAGDDHSDANLQGVCTWCHGRKSAAEGAAARKARGYVTQRRRGERHPGIVAPFGSLG